MGKKLHTPAERARIRKAAAERRHAKEVRQMIVLTVSLVAVIAVIFIAGMIKDAITLPVEIRNLNAIEDSWVVIDADVSPDKRFHHPATFIAPAGYTPDSFITLDDDVQQNILVKAESPDASVASINVFGAVGYSAEEFIQRAAEMSADALNDGVTVEVGEPFTAVVAGENAHCVYLRYTSASAEAESSAYGCLYLGFDAPRKVCVYSVLSGAYTSPENVQTAESLLADAETLLAGLTIIR